MSESAEELTNYVNCNLSFGCIKRLRVRNFMCHKDIDLALGERINFIIGINGIRSQLFQNYCGLNVDFHVKAIQLLVVVVL
ncbi:Structural maintenance of chromosomes protein 6 [Trichinella sp. T8]|nr:Structural maintenance of chromosomes protein 6 [Trichinella sp. T8]